MAILATCQNRELLWGENTFSNDMENGATLTNIHADAFPGTYIFTTASDMGILTDEFNLVGLNCYTIDPMTFEKIYEPIVDELWYRFSIILEETTIQLGGTQTTQFWDEFLFPDGMNLKYKTDGTWKYDGFINNLFEWVPELKLPVGAKFDSETVAGGNYFTYYSAGHTNYRFTWKLVIDIFKSEQDFLDATPGVASGDLADFLNAKVFTSRSEYDQYKIDNPISEELDIVLFEGPENQQSLNVYKSPNTFRDFFIKNYAEERKEIELAFGITKLEEYETVIENGKEVSKYFMVDGVRMTGKNYLQYLLDNGYIRRFT